MQAGHFGPLALCAHPEFMGRPSPSTPSLETSARLLGFGQHTEVHGINSSKTFEKRSAQPRRTWREPSETHRSIVSGFLPKHLTASGRLGPHRLTILRTSLRCNNQRGRPGLNGSRNEKAVFAAATRTYDDSDPSIRVGDLYIS